MNESTIQAVLMQYAMEELKHQIAIPNVTRVYRWEADLLSITRSLIVHEYEIKVTRADFLADARKRDKHHCLLQRWKLPNKKPDREAPLLPSLNKVLPPATPNYFWYVTWGFDIAELPPYAGWLSIARDGRGRYAVQYKAFAPKLHNHKMGQKAYGCLSRWLSYKLKNMYRMKYLNSAAAEGANDAKVGE